MKSGYPILHIRRPLELRTQFAFVVYPFWHEPQRRQEQIYLVFHLRLDPAKSLCSVGTVLVTMLFGRDDVLMCPFIPVATKAAI